MTILDEMQGKNATFTIKTEGHDLVLVLRPYTLRDAIFLGRRFNEGKIIRAFENLEMDVICEIVAYQLDDESKSVLDNVVLVPQWAIGSKFRKFLFNITKPVRALFKNRLYDHSIKLQYLVMMNDAFFAMVNAITENRAINSPDVVDGYNKKKTKLSQNQTITNTSI